MGGLDKRAPFTATGGIIPPEFQNVKTPCYILDEKALIKNAKLLGEVSERTGCKMLLAQKAFSNYDCYRFFEPYLAGTEASGLFEARLGAEEMPGKEVHVFCAGYRADEFEELLQYAAPTYQEIVGNVGDVTHGIDVEMVGNTGAIHHHCIAINFYLIYSYHRNFFTI